MPRKPELLRLGYWAHWLAPLQRRKVYKTEWLFTHLSTVVLDFQVDHCATTFLQGPFVRSPFLAFHPSSGLPTGLRGTGLDVMTGFDSSSLLCRHMLSSQIGRSVTQRGNVWGSRWRKNQHDCVDKNSRNGKTGDLATEWFVPKMEDKHGIWSEETEAGCPHANDARGVGRHLQRRKPGVGAGG